MSEEQLLAIPSISMQPVACTHGHSGASTENSTSCWPHVRLPTLPMYPPFCTVANPCHSRWLEFALLNCYGSYPTPGVNFFTNPEPAAGNVALAVTQTCKK